MMSLQNVMGFSGRMGLRGQMGFCCHLNFCNKFGLRNKLKKRCADEQQAAGNESEKSAVFSRDHADRVGDGGCAAAGFDAAGCQPFVEDIGR
jgi:hypothetical protein